MTAHDNEYILVQVELLDNRHNIQAFLEAQADLLDGSTIISQPVEIWKLHPGRSRT